MNVCRICLRPAAGTASYHSRCLLALFQSRRPPAAIDIDMARLHTAGLAMVGRTSLSGVQRKISVNLSGDRQTLQVAIGPGRFVLKPPSQTFPELPANELLTMRIVSAAGVDIPPCGLVALADATPAYIVRRFDREEDGTKRRQEDFCQLAGLRPKQKYEGSAELCARIVRQFASAPPIESLKLYRQLLCAWWVGDGDAHLKNFSLLTDADGVVRLSPAYDRLCTRLVLPDDQLALTVGGRRSGLGRADWERFGVYCELPPRTVERELQRVVRALAPALALIATSPLSTNRQSVYAELLRRHTAALEK